MRIGFWLRKERSNCRRYTDQLYALGIEFRFYFGKREDLKNMSYLSSFCLSESKKEETGEFPQPRRFFHRICTHGYFDLGISAVIVLNVICMAMEHYNQPEVRNRLISNLVL